MRTCFCVSEKRVQHTYILYNNVTHICICVVINHNNMCMKQNQSLQVARLLISFGGCVYTRFV